MKRRIILVCGKNPLNSAGGYAKYTYNLGKILQELGQRPTIFCFGKRNETIKSEIGEVRIIKSTIFNLPILKSHEMAGLILLAPLLASAINKSTVKSDIIWGIGPWASTGLFLKNKSIILADYFTSIKHEFKGALIGTNINDYGILRKSYMLLAYFTIIQLYTVLEKLLLQKSDYIITHYQSTRKILQDQFKIDIKKFKHLPYHIASNRLQNGIRKSKPPLVLLISRHDPRKGINHLLHAIEILNRKGIKYQVKLIGNGTFFEANMKLANKLKLRNVFLHGFVKNTNKYLSSAALYAFPSVEEGSSALSLLEAMSYSLPIVSTDIDGIKEDLKDKKNSLLVPPSRPDQLAKAINKLLKDSEYANKLGRQARKDLLKNHAKDVVKSSINSFLKSI